MKEEYEIYILNTSLIVDFINLDLCSAFRQYVSTELSAKYDKRQAMTKINIVMSEGYKKSMGLDPPGAKHHSGIIRSKQLLIF